MLVAYLEADKTLLSHQATWNSAKLVDSTINGASFAI